MNQAKKGAERAQKGSKRDTADRGEAMLLKGSQQAVFTGILGRETPPAAKQLPSDRSTKPARESKSMPFLCPSQRLTYSMVVKWWSRTCRPGSGERGVRSAEFGVRSSEYGVMRDPGEQSTCLQCWSIRGRLATYPTRQVSNLPHDTRQVGNLPQVTGRARIVAESARFGLILALPPLAVDVPTKN